VLALQAIGLLIVSSLAIASSVSRENRLPPQFVGEWCQIHADRYEPAEVPCNVISVAAFPHAQYQVKFRWQGEGQTPWEQTNWLTMQLCMREAHDR
jgi:hypothetical protein